MCCFADILQVLLSHEPRIQCCYVGPFHPGIDARHKHGTRERYQHERKLYAHGAAWRVDLPGVTAW